MAQRLSDFSLGNDVTSFGGVVLAQSAVRGDADALRYDIFLRNSRDRNLVHRLTNYKINSMFKGVEVVAAVPGSPAWAYQTPSGLFVFAYEILEFTENCT